MIARPLALGPLIGKHVLGADQHKRLRLAADCAAKPSYVVGYSPRGQPPICMPNRSTMMTGRVPSGHGTRFNGIPLDRAANTFIRVLRAAGCRTGLILFRDLEDGLARGGRRSGGRRRHAVPRADPQLDATATHPQHGHLNVVPDSNGLSGRPH